jgi:predicted AlkP superfamily phosphohydrolase/phosphomutase
MLRLLNPTRQSPARSRFLLAAVALSVLAGTSCRATDARPRVLLIGIDGATFRVAEPLLAQGRLPHLAGIAARGVSGPLESFLPLHSPRIWNSIATGKTPEAHGIETFVRTDAQGNHLYLSSDRKVPALWNIASSRGLTVGVINWWNTYPPERVDGIMVSDHFFPEQIANIRQTFKAVDETAGPYVHPESWEGTARAAVSAPTAPLVPFTDPFAGNAELPPWLRPEGLSRQYRIDTDVTRVALAVDAAIHPDLLMVYLPGIDRVSHALWGNLEPPELYPERLRPTPTQRAAGVAALERYYEYTDALIGRLIEGFGDDALVLVVSDHGFEAGARLVFLTGQHETAAAAHGVLFACGPAVPAAPAAGPVTINDVAPTVLAALGLPVATDMAGRPAAFLDVPAPAEVASYDGLRVERVSAKASAVEGQMIEQLRELGYLE